jgi:DNA-binding CsgD family transcriptional regulator
MRALRERDAAALAAVVAELLTTEDAEPFSVQVVTGIADLMATRDAEYCVLDRVRRRGLVWVDAEGAPESAKHEDFFRLIRTHPICGYRSRAGDWTSTRKVSDFVGRREFRRTEIWNELYADHAFDDWIDVGLAPERGCTHMFLFRRDRGEFDERDRSVLDVLQPYLQRRYDVVKTTSEATEALASLTEDSGDGPSRIVLCARNGVIEFGSPRTRRLLTGYVDLAGGRVPTELLRTLLRRTVSVDRDGHRLTLRAATVGDLVVLLLSEEDRRLERLTPRQRTIVERLAHGETDAEIAAALGIARRTVNTHLRAIYERLGVHTRTAAAGIYRGVVDRSDGSP